MERLFLTVITAIFLSGCSVEEADSKDGTKYIGIWVNKKPENRSAANSFVIDDRILIEPKPKIKNRYNVSILARGVFTEMQYHSENGLLCTLKNSGKACFKLENKDTLTVGSETGTVDYERAKR